MDGTDGIAGVEALFVFGVGGGVLYKQGADALAAVAWLLCAVVVGFLKWNWPKAQVFMGDVCSGFLGYLVAVFALIGAKLYDTPLCTWMILYGVFWIDALITLGRRFARGETWYTAHRMHAYQRLHHTAGWSHTRILWGVVFLNTILAGLALISAFYPEMSVLCLVVATCFMVLVYAGIERIAPM